jgi:hypothetical protein
MRAEVARISPDDVAGYERFVRRGRGLLPLGFEQLGSKAFDSLGDLLAPCPADEDARLAQHHRMVAGHMRTPSCAWCSASTRC